MLGQPSAINSEPNGSCHDVLCRSKVGAIHEGWATMGLPDTFKRYRAILLLLACYLVTTSDYTVYANCHDCYLISLRMIAVSHAKRDILSY